MRPTILLPVLTVLILSSCSTSYKTGQTPDDLYFSPARPEEDYRQKEEDKKEDESTSYQQSDDNYLRLKTRNRYRWSEFDDDTYYYNRRYSYSSGYCNCSCFGTPWIPSYYWNNYFNPYHQPYIITDPKKAAVYNAPRHFNLNAYTGNTAGTTNTRTDNSSGNISKYPGSNGNEPRNKPARNESNAGNLLRDIFRGSNSSSSGNNTNSNSSSSSSSSSGSGSSGSSGSSAPVRKF